MANAPTTANTPDTTQWSEPLLANPHAVADKSERVRKMFSAIAPSYDLNNRLHSLWCDQYWRRVAVKMADVKPTDRVVDVACGTGDLTLKFAAKSSDVVGIDFTYEMLPIARRKSAASHAATFINGDALNLPLPDASADIISIAFGIRNVQNWQACIKEFTRVLRPGGRMIILEFSLPTNKLLLAGYNFYFRKIMPRTATLISGDKTGAYKYLPESVNTFISRDAMQNEMRANGLTGVVARPLTFGICVCYKGTKP